jgi:ABC-type multidrug transport system fused ATPase/permease subunit
MLTSLWTGWSNSIRLFSLAADSAYVINAFHLVKLFKYKPENDPGNAGQKDETGVQVIQLFQGRIEFRNVTFYYPGSKRAVFQKLNLLIEAGTKVALLG